MNEQQPESTVFPRRCGRTGYREADARDLARRLQETYGFRTLVVACDDCGSHHLRSVGRSRAPRVARPEARREA